LELTGSERALFPEPVTGAAGEADAFASLNLHYTNNERDNPAVRALLHEE
jgi:hypothetical protein